MWGRLALEAGRALVVVVAVIAGLLVAGGGGFVAACKLTSLNCHLHRGGGANLSLTTGQISLPAGFSAEAVGSGWNEPTAFDLLPDGRILVAEKNGLVRMVVDGKTSPTPVLDLRGRINTAFLRGIVGLSVDPDFERNHFIYVAYTPKRSGATALSQEPTHVVISRFVMSGSRAGQERVILGAGGKQAGDCAKVPARTDCIPAEIDHIGADIQFAPDGTLFVSTGEGGGLEHVESAAFNAQDVDSLGGKILHVDREGNGLPSNPFFNGDKTANRSKVWALGFRNPFRFTVAPDGKFLAVGDVGWTSVDEVDIVKAGGNYGWPCFEGDSQTREYRSTSQCKALYASKTVFVKPTIALHGGAKAVVGGVFVSGGGYPTKYRAYLYADWVSGSIRYAAINPATGQLTGVPSDFAKNAGGPVQFRIGPDGRPYVLALNYQTIYRITYKR
jgi:glucose/arabinose dehydrogenase